MIDVFLKNKAFKALEGIPDLLFIGEPLEAIKLYIGATHGSIEIFF